MSFNRYLVGRHVEQLVRLDHLVAGHMPVVVQVDQIEQLEDGELYS